MTTVLFLGLGHMGGPMAANLAAAGHRVLGFDLVPEALEKARAAGVETVTDTAAAAAEADVVLTMLPHGRLVLDVYRGEDGDGGLLAAARPGTVFLDCSTIDVAEAREAAAAAEAAGMRAADAPVSGGQVGAEAGTLSFMVGGDPADQDGVGLPGEFHCHRRHARGRRDGQFRPRAYRGGRSRRPRLRRGRARQLACLHPDRPCRRLRHRRADPLRPITGVDEGLDGPVVGARRVAEGPVAVGGDDDPRAAAARRPRMGGLVELRVPRRVGVQVDDRFDRSGHRNPPRFHRRRAIGPSRPTSSRNAASGANPLT